MTGLEKMLKKKLPEETFAAVKGALEDTDFDWVPRSRLDDVIEERDTARQDLSAARKELEKAGDYTALKNKYDTDIAAKDAEIAQIKRDHKIDSALTSAKAKNLKAVKALLEVDKMKEDLSDLDAAVEALKKSDPYLFDDGVPGGTGRKEAGDPGSGSGEDDDKVTSAMFNAVMGGIY